MFSYGAGLPHFLIVMLVGFLWIIVLAVIAAILFFTIRYAVLSAQKAHTRWVDAGKPAGSAWSQQPAPHPGFGADAAAVPPAAPAAPVVPDTAPEAPASTADAVAEPEASAPAVPPKAPAKPRTPRTPKTPDR